MDPDWADDERKLTALLSQGDEAGFAEVYDRFGLRLYRIAFRVLRNTALAEEAVQELFVALVRSRQRLRDVRHLSAYLFTALRRRLPRLLEQDARQRDWQTTPRPVTESECTERSAFIRDWHDELALLLDRLPVEQREVVLLRVDGELSWSEIGEVLEISSNTAASRYRYALEKLREHLKAREQGTS